MKEKKDHGAALAAVEGAGSIASDAAPHVAHTPGPWRAGRSDMATVVDGHDSKWIYADDADTGLSLYVALASGLDVSPWDEVIANAHLIAAAPEMYEALRTICAMADCSHIVSGPDLEIDVPPAQAAMRSARAAIAKAEGRQ